MCAGRVPVCHRRGRDLTSATAAVGDRHSLDDTAKAHDRVDAGGGHSRILLTIPQ
jgi:NADPH2:quinone reductase